MSDTERVEIHRGLNGVYFDRSEICFIDGREGRLQYRGYSIDDLAVRSTFEETSYLLLFGHLPAPAELAEFEKELQGARSIPDDVLDLIRLVKTDHPINVLRTGVSSLSSFDPDAGDKSPEAALRRGIRLIAKIPTIVAAHHAIRHARGPVAPSPHLSHAANFLYMLEGYEPTPDAARLMDRDFILHAEHGANASTFAARAITSTGAAIDSAIAGAIAALSGPLHGGAAENVMRMAREIGEPGRAADYVRDVRARREPVMGFGHRVYRAEDPRAKHLREGVERLSVEKGEPKWYAILQAVVEAMQPFARHGVNVNVDFYSGVVYYLQGIPEDLFVPIFAVGRAPGWVAHVLEQMDGNMLIRPLLEYTGPRDREYTPIDGR